MSYNYETIEHFYQVLANKVDKKIDLKGKRYTMKDVDDCPTPVVMYGWLADRVFDAYTEEYEKNAKLEEELELALETVDDMRDALEKIAGCYMLDAAKLMNDSLLCTSNADNIYGYLYAGDAGNCEEGCCCDNTCKD